MNAQSIFKKIILLSLLLGGKVVIGASPVLRAAIKALDYGLEAYAKRGTSFFKPDEYNSTFARLMNARIQYERLEIERERLRLEIARHNNSLYKPREQQLESGEEVF